MSSKPIFAIMYDFDRTLCPKDMQEYQFIPSLGMRAEEFWSLANSYAYEHKMDKINAYMYMILTATPTGKASIFTAIQITAFYRRHQYHVMPKERTSFPSFCVHRIITEPKITLL